MNRTQLFGVLLLTTASLFGDSGMPERSRSMKKMNSDSYSQYMEREVKGERSGVELSADYLYLTAHEDGLEYAVTGLWNVGSDGNFPRGQIYTPHFKWSSGFRVGAVYSLPEVAWDMGVNWTKFRTHARGSQTASNSGLISQQLWPIWLHQAGDVFTPVQSASTNWNLQFNTVDAEFGKMLMFGSYFTMRPFLGLRGAWVNQRLKQTYQQTSTFAVYNRMNNGFQGVGFRSGLDTSFYFTKNWSLIAEGAYSLILGRFKISQLNFDVAGNTVNTAFNFSAMKSATELGLGLKWEDDIYDDEYHIAIDAGWEFQEWSDQNQMLRWAAGAALLNNPPSSSFNGEVYHQHGDLFLQGFRLRVALDF